MSKHQDSRLDEMIKEVVDKEEVIPQSVRDKKYQAYEEIRRMAKQSHTSQKPRKQNTTKKWLVAAGLMAAIGVGTQTDTFAEIKELLFGGNYKGVESAIEDGYIQTVEGVVSESQGIRLEVIEALRDPLAIHLKMKVSTEDPEIIKKHKYNVMSDTGLVDQLTLVDDKGHVLQGVDEEGAYTVPIRGEDGEKIWLISSSMETVDLGRIEEGEVIIDMVYSSSQGALGDISGLTISAKEMGDIKGDWKMQIDFDSEQLQMDTVDYQAIETNEKLEIVSAKLHPTGLVIEVIIKEEVDESIVKDGKIITADGSVYETDRPGWMESVEEGSRVSLTFGVGQEALGDSFVFRVDSIEGEEGQIALGKKK